MYKLRKVIQALQADGKARQGKLPPDNLGNRQLSLACINPHCDGRATVNYAIRSDHGNDGLYVCHQCELAGDSLSLVMWLAGEDLDPDGELSNRESAEVAHIWLEHHLGKPEKPEEPEPEWEPPWVTGVW